MYQHPWLDLNEVLSSFLFHAINKAEPTLALKPRGDVTRSPKQGYQWPHKKDSCPPKIFKKKKKKKGSSYLCEGLKFISQQLVLNTFQVFIAEIYVQIAITTSTATVQALNWRSDCD